MQSMTGFGKAEYKDKKHSLAIELSSVNNRFLEYNIRLPRELGGLEPMIKETIGRHVDRGKINVNVNFDDYGISLNRLVLNEPMADDIYEKLNNLKERYNLTGEIDINHFLTFPDIFKIEKPSDLEKLLWPLVEKALKDALKKLIAMRRKEGENLKRDVSSRLKLLSGYIAEIVENASSNREAHKESLERRIGDIIKDHELDRLRLEEEVAYIVERADITEEAVRFESHLKQFRGALRQAGPAGKKLTFILQELNREANTIGAKCSDSEIARKVVDIKDELEKIREQVQNIE
jgi:uncharacterized protein (TIGR00255 family)